MRYDQEKKITRIAPTKALVSERETSSLKRVAAYCRVSTDEEDQINSYEIQKRKYTEKILSEPGWTMVGIYADRGITGTSVANRDEFKKMIRHCKKGKIDMIITKSVSRFARNTLDTLTYTRSLREIGIDVFFEEQNIHSIDPSSDFMISLYGSLAQSESESISENVKWGKRQSAKEGKVPFNCKNFLGYRKNSDGQIEIVPEEAEIVRYIYRIFIDGKTFGDISKNLNNQGILTKGGKKWQPQVIRSIIENVKYKGDVITNKTFRNSITSKKIRQNSGEVEQFYISHHHPAIIDDVTFARAHAELERRTSLENSFKKNARSENGKYNSKYVFSDIVFCGECGMHYKRRIWMAPNGVRQGVWRCVKRVEYGKRYCHNSPSMHEETLQRAVMDAITKGTEEDLSLMTRLDDLVQIGLENSEIATKLQRLQDELSNLSKQLDIMIDAVNLDGDYDEEEIRKVSEKKYSVEEEINRLKSYELSQSKEIKLKELRDLIAVCAGNPLCFDDDIVRKCIERIIVKDKQTIEITFADGHTVTQKVNQKRQ